MKMMSVTEILQTVRYSVDFGSVEYQDGETEDDQRTSFWKEVINDKANDTGFERLCLSILENGWQDGSCVGFNKDAQITEGHHRLCAAILLCLDEVPVTNHGHSTCFGFSAHHDPEGFRMDIEV